MTIFDTLPAPTWPRDRAVPGLKAEATEALQGRAPTTLWWRWAALGPDQPKGKKPPTPNQHGVGLGIACLVDGLEPWLDSLDRWYNWQEAALMGRTYRKAEALGGDYQQLYILTSCLIIEARDGVPLGITDRPLLDLRRHAAINALLRVPGSFPPRSYSLGARTAIPDETVPSALACILDGLDPENWGEHGGQPLKGQLERPGRLTGLAVLKAMLDSGEVVLPTLDTFGEVVDEILATNLRLPGTLTFGAIGAYVPESWGAEFDGEYLLGAETTGGTLKQIAAGDLPNIPTSLDWHLKIGPAGLVPVVAPAWWKTREAPPVQEPEDPHLPPLPPEPEPTTSRYLVHSRLRETDNQLEAAIRATATARKAGRGAWIPPGLEKDLRDLRRQLAFALRATREGKS